ncbi:hypothetical protein B296_00042406 [Ensete ventricosum]|uniref:Uncharacterized protein n=1 Tax=Ensete ventricosum TaxID=4639 RepID=A0A426YTZ7_ENSVE|nr:hypothetical protein B296_00042406 [Ensete ventricosum]
MPTYHSAHVRCQPIITPALHKDNRETRHVDNDVWLQAALARDVAPRPENPVKPYPE